MISVEVWKIKFQASALKIDTKNTAEQKLIELFCEINI